MHYDYLFVGGGLASGLCVLALLDADLVFASPSWNAKRGSGATTPGASMGATSAPQSALGRSARRAALARLRGALSTAHAPRRFALCVRDERTTPRGALGALRKARCTPAPREKRQPHRRPTMWCSKTASSCGPSWSWMRAGQVSSPHGAQGFQKFVGLELRWNRPRSVKHEPVLMDACLPQQDGFRFMYLLPFDCGPLALRGDVLLR